MAPAMARDFPPCVSMGGRTCTGPAVALWLGLIAGAGLGVAGSLACVVAATALLWLSCRALARTGTLLVIVAFALLGVARGEAHRVQAASQARYVATDPAATWIDATVVEAPARSGSTPFRVVRIDVADP